MTVLPDHWAIYARQQDALSRSTSLTDHSWGLEGSLSDQLDAIGEGKLVSLKDARRRVATGARRVRHRRHLLAKYGPSHWGTSSATANRGEMRVVLGTLARTMAPAEFQLLAAAAGGATHQEIASALNVSAVSIRQRISRARRAHLHVIK